ncbi:MAG: aminotransferase class V-fold PLP-dependent enzyme, partial [Bacteroidia bacterium]
SVIPEGTTLLVINNGIYAERIIEIAQKFNISVKSIHCSPYAIVSLDELTNALLADSTISTVAMVHHETSTGLLNPITEIGSLVKKHSKTFIVDAISSYAGIPIDIQKAQVDYLIATSNKCLQGIPGISFVLANIENLSKNGQNGKGFYFDLYGQYKSLEQNNVLRFTPPVQVFYALNQALEEYFIEGEINRFNRYKENCHILMQGLSDLGFTFLIQPELQSHLLVLIKLPNELEHISFTNLHDRLYSKGFTIYPTSIRLDHAFRLACFGDINKNDIVLFLNELKTALIQLK